MSTAGLAPKPRPTRTRATLPPHLDGGLPFLGHALEFNRNPIRFVQRAREMHGDIFALTLAGRKVAVLTGPKANEAFFRAPDDLTAAASEYCTIPCETSHAGGELHLGFGRQLRGELLAHLYRGAWDNERRSRRSLQCAPGTGPVC